MKKLISILFGLSSLGLTAQTEVSGIISSDTDWTPEDSPYLITNNIRVNNGATLTIAPGVEVLFTGLFSFQVFGELQAVGTDNNKIRFSSANTTPEKGAWKFIEFSENSSGALFDSDHNYLSGSRIENALIEYGGGDNQSASLKIVNTSIYLHKVVVRESGKSGVSFQKGPGGTISKSVISQSEFYGNFYNGIECSCYNYSKSLIVLNSVSHSNGGSGISTLGGDSGGSHYFEFIGNEIYSNNDSGIDALANGTQFISENIIYDNDFGIWSRGNGQFSITKNILHNNSKGLSAVYANHIIQNNVFTKNSNGGIEIKQGGSYLVEGNVLLGNDGFVAGINTQNAWSPEVVIKDNLLAFNNSELATVDSFNPENGNPTFGLYNNKFFRNTAPYEFKNRRLSYLADIDASSNFWDTDNEQIIADRIFDWFDDSSIGLVNYTPIKSLAQEALAVLPNTQLDFTIQSNGIYFSWDPNMEQNIAGYRLHFGNPTGHSYENNIDLGLVTSYFFENADPNIEYALTSYTIEADGIDDFFDGNESWFTVFGEEDNALSQTPLLPSIDFYPNPTKSVVHVDSDFAFLKVYSINGQLLLHTASKTIDLSFLSKGVYFLKIYDKDNSLLGSSKLLKDSL